MEHHNQVKCIFTDLAATPVISHRDRFEYTVDIHGKIHFISLQGKAVQWPNDNEFFKANKHIFSSLLYNDNWFEEEENTYITIDELKELLRSKSFPNNPREKMESLFFELFSYQKEDGEWIAISMKDFDNQLWKELYFKSVNELSYYMEVLEKNELIETKYISTKFNALHFDSYRMTFKGLNHYVKITNEGEKSNKCFVAMSFKPETKEIRQAIKDALDEAHFEPVLMDEQDIESDKTINDEIIANLKKCKFCIADFTLHSDGVYFESGFALGQGKKVIYTCRQDEFNKAHFDIKPLQHIIYETPAELKQKLFNKIEAWIK